MAKSPEDLSTNEAAELLNREAQTLRLWACKCRGPIKPQRVGRRLVWSASAIKALVYSIPHECRRMPGPIAARLDLMLNIASATHRAETVATIAADPELSAKLEELVEKLTHFLRNVDQEYKHKKQTH